MKKLFNYLFILFGVIVFSSCSNYSIEGSVLYGDRKLPDVDAEIVMYNFEGDYIGRTYVDINGDFVFNRLKKDKYILAIKSEHSGIFPELAYERYKKKFEVLQEIFSSDTFIECKNTEVENLIEKGYSLTRKQAEYRDSLIRETINTSIRSLKTPLGISPGVIFYYIGKTDGQLKLETVDFTDGYTDKNKQMRIRFYGWSPSYIVSTYNLYKQN